MQSTDGSPDVLGAGALAGGRAGPAEVRELVGVAVEALAGAAAGRTGPAPAGGPAAVAAALAAAGVDLLPEQGVGDVVALGELTRLLAAGSVDPAHPWCAAHLHCPPVAVSAAAELVASVLNPSMDSWDQAPMASELERALTSTLASLCFPSAADPDAVVTGGGTESNLLGLLLARQESPAPPRPVCGRTAHHSVARAAWLLGLAQPDTVDCPGERMCPEHLAETLRARPDPAVVVATAGTTDAGYVDPLRKIAAVSRSAGARLHVDAAYGGAALFSDRLRGLLDGLELADTVALDLHKLGWQPIAAGLFAVRRARSLGALAVRTGYLNATDDTDAGLPDLLGRSVRTSRRADVFKIAVTLRALGRTRLAALVEHCCRTATELAGAIRRHQELALWGDPELSTVLFRPLAADRLAASSGDAAGNALVAGLRRRLLDDGVAVLGRSTVQGSDRLWLKLTLLHPSAAVADYLPLLDIVAAAASKGRP